jgi:ATP-dependent DNA ligase
MACAPIYYAQMPPGYAIAPPVEPMLSKVADEIPRGGSFLFEPKWDGFRAIVFRGNGGVYLQSRDLKPLDRYFPELHDGLSEALPDGCVVDGEIVIATPHGLDFDRLQLRLHPAASRAAKLAKETPSEFVAFDLLAADGRDVRAMPFEQRREQLERLLKRAGPPVHLTPMTRDRDVAVEWLERFEGAGLDGVMAKPAHGAYEPGKRVMYKIKHSRTADCAVGGFRWHKNGQGTHVGSLLLGLYDDSGALQHVGVTSAFTMPQRKELAGLLEPLRKHALKEHPWREWASVAGDMQRMPGGQSRWSAGKDLSWEPVRTELVCEVKYDHMQRDRFRHAAIFQRWRPDKQPRDCTYDQLEITAPYELEKIFAASQGNR